MGFLLKLHRFDQKGVIPGACAVEWGCDPHHRDDKPPIMAVANIRIPVRRMVLPPQRIKVCDFCSNFPPYDHTDTYLTR